MALDQLKDKTRPLDGKNKILLFRRFEDRHKEQATRLVFQKEHTLAFNRAIDRFVTKDGSVVKPGELETSISITAVQSVNDPTAEMLQQAVVEGEMLEVWEVNLDPEAKDEEGKFPSIYARGYLDSWEMPAGAEGEAEISTNFIIDRKPQRGYTELDKELEEAIQYDFHDVKPMDEEENELP